MAKGVTVKWNNPEKRLAGNLDRAQVALDSDVLRRCDPFIPADTFKLRDSGIIATVPGTGKVVWNMPYARAQYYGYPNKSKDHHEEATTFWFAAAKAIHGKQWIATAKRIGGAR